MGEYRQVDGWENSCIEAQTGEWLDGEMDDCMEKVHVCMHAWVNSCLEGRMGGWMYKLL